MTQTFRTPREITVRGHGQFPIDMLRYDRASPLREQDSATILRTFMRGAGRVVVKVRAERLTEDRWNSFGWEVVPEPTLPKEVTGVMYFRARFETEKGALREERFEYDYDAMALVEPFARSLAREGETFLGVVREPSPMSRLIGGAR